MILPQLRFQDGLLAGCCILLFSVQMGTAGVVTDCSEANLRAAMEGGGLVTFACDGTFTLGSTLAISEDTVIDATGRSVTITGNETMGLFVVDAGRGLTLLNLTLANGRSTSGGAIWSEGGIVNATNCVFRGNLAVGTNAAAGGAIYSSGGSLGVVRCIFSGNRVVINGAGAAGTNGTNTAGSNGGQGSAAAGGAIWNSGEFLILESYFTDNTSTGGLGGTGGTGGAAVSQSGGFPGGSGGVGGDAAGGAVYHQAGTMRVIGSTLASNSVSGGLGGTGGTGGNGGAAPGGVGGSGGAGGTGFGAGIHADSGTVLATNNTWFSNRAVGGNGGSGGGGPSC